MLLRLPRPRSRAAQQTDMGFYLRQSEQSMGAAEWCGSKRAMAPLSALIIPNYLECPAGCCQGKTGCIGGAAATARAKSIPPGAATAA